MLAETFLRGVRFLGFFDPNSRPNFGLTQSNFALTQPIFALNRPNFPLNSKFQRKMVKIFALTQQIRSNFGPNSAQKMVKIRFEN